MLMYCKKDKDTGEYNFFFGNKIAVRMCGVALSDIVQVAISETTSDNATHWAYKELPSEEFHYIYPDKRLVQMCSPDFFRRSIALREGDIVQVSITEVEEE